MTQILNDASITSQQLTNENQAALNHLQTLDQGIEPFSVAENNPIISMNEQTFNKEVIKEAVDG